MSDANNHFEQAQAVRRQIVRMLHRVGGGHYGGSLSSVDILLVLWREFLGYGADRDRFVLSKGHAAPALYAAMAATGHLDSGMLERYGVDGGFLPSHPEYDGAGTLADFSTGSLGQGLSAALGMALVLKSLERRAWVLLGDGECQEGQVWEAAMLASRLRVGNLVAVVDCNGRQEWGYSEGPPVEGLAGKWSAFGWKVHEVDGHDPVELSRTFAALRASTRSGPAVVMARTIKGRGFAVIEGAPARFHCGALEASEFAACQV